MINENYLACIYIQERPLFSIFETSAETFHKLNVSVLSKVENMTPPKTGVHCSVGSDENTTPPQNTTQALHRALWICLYGRIENMASPFEYLQWILLAVCSVYIY